MNARLIALMGTMSAVSIAAADTVKLSYRHPGQGQIVQITVGGNTRNVFAGQLNHEFKDGTGAASGLAGPLVTFCVDAAESSTLKWATHTVTPMNQLPASLGYASMGAERSQEIYDLYSVAAGSQLGTGTSADLAAAFQVALWEIVYDFNAAEGRSSLDVSAGVMKVGSTSGGVLGASMLSLVNSFFDSIVAFSGPQGGLMGLGANGSQDQVVMIPLPPGALLGFAGLAGLAVVTVIRRRSK
jgi:hypothetical protein